MITGTYTRVFSFTSPDTANSRFSGLYAVNISNVPYLTMVYGTTASTSAFKGVKYDGSSWSETAEITAANSIGRIKAEIVYRNQLHIIDAVPNAIIWNPITETISSPSNSFGEANIGLCVFNDRLFGVSSASGGGVVTSLSEFTGTWTVVVSGFSTSPFGTTGAPPTTNSGNQCLFTDGTNMYCLISGLYDLAQGGLTAGEGGWRCYQFDSNLAVTNLTTTVVPAGLRAVADGGSGSGVLGAFRDRFFSFTDIDTTPGSQTTWLHYAALGPTGAVAFDLFVWNGPGSTMTLSGGSGGSSEHSVASLSTSGGEYIGSTGDLDVWITGVASDPLGTLISFQASGDSGATLNNTVTFRVDYEGEPKITQATLVGTATGGTAVRVGDSVTSVKADGTAYTIVWDNGTDAPSSAWRAGLVPFIETIVI